MIPVSIRPSSPQRKKLDKRIDELPVLPVVVTQLLALDSTADDFFDRVLRLIESEPAFAARLLAAANSATYAARAPITTLRAALGRVGCKNAATLVLSIAVAHAFTPRDPWEKDVWKHALRVAFTARALALRSGEPDLPPDEAYTAGLLHDVGRFVLFHEAPEELRHFPEEAGDAAEPLLHAERSLCGLARTDVGALACKKWRLPDVIASIVSDHHAPPASRLSNAVRPLVELIRFVEHATHSPALHLELESGVVDDGAVQAELGPHLPDFLGSTRLHLPNILRSSSFEANALCEVLGVA